MNADGDDLVNMEMQEEAAATMTEGQVIIRDGCARLCRPRITRIKGERVHCNFYIAGWWNLAEPGGDCPSWRQERYDCDDASRIYEPLER